jgi:hypothetical protein
VRACHSPLAATAIKRIVNEFFDNPFDSRYKHGKKRLIAVHSML